MSKNLERTIKEENKIAEDLKQKVGKMKGRVSSSTRKDTEANEEEINRLSEEIEKLQNNYEILEKSYRTQLKKVYLNPYYQRTASNQNDKLSEGLYIYNRESIYPYSDSLFI